MGRIKIKIEGKFIFSYQDQIRVTDLNYGNHLGNDKVLGLFHAARVSWMKSINQNEFDFFGKALIQHDTIINYKAEAFCHDKITIDLFIHDIERSYFDFYYKIIKDSHKKEIAIGKTGMTFLNYQTKKIEEAPALFRKQFGEAND